MYTCTQAHYTTEHSKCDVNASPRWLKLLQLKAHVNRGNGVHQEVRRQRDRRGHRAGPELDDYERRGLGGTRERIHLSAHVARLLASESSATPNSDSSDGYVLPADVDVVAASPRCALCRRSCAAGSSPSTSSGAVARYTGPCAANGAGIALERERCELLPQDSTRHSGRSVSHKASRVHSRGRSRRAARPASPRR